MADTSILEVARQTHEEAERYEAALADLLLAPAATHKEQLKKNHKASDLLDRIVNRAAFLHTFYLDASGERKQELTRLVAGSGDGANDSEQPQASSSSSSPPANGETDVSMREFYNRLAKVKDYHKRYPGALPDAFSLDFSALERGGSSGHVASAEAAADIDFVDRMFSGEESAGRFLDLHLHHDAFLNLKGARRINYLQYLDDVDKLAGEGSRIPDSAKRTDAYRKYLIDLQAYLSTFLRKTRPLSDVDEMELRAVVDFEEQWEAGKVIGWEDRGETILTARSEIGSANVKGKGKEAKGAQQGPAGEGIWCEACQRSYSKQTVYDAHLRSPKHQKAAQKLEAAAAAVNGEAEGNATSGSGQHALEKARREAKAKALARDEALVRVAAEALRTVLGETRANVERRAALTDRERQAEAEAAAMEGSADAANAPVEGAAGEDDEAGDEKIYNPLKLPLGWDGKPIPFWLYKLHGLSVEFKCEICSDFVYQGRKNFERHFSESRHAFGMRALGLPNTKHFHEITRIEDALALAEKLRREGKQNAASSSAAAVTGGGGDDEGADAEEVEDEAGNTYTRKTYELLKRQGLV